MSKRPKHPKKEIEEAIKIAESCDWHYKPSGHSAHAWGRLLCPSSNRDGCMMSIWSTPRCAQTHAKQILHAIKLCSHGEKDHER